MTVRVDLPVPARALAVGAHPDDIEFGCGATLAKWAAAGAAVTLCICTDGGKGTWDAAADLAALVATREQEQRKAAAVLGAADVIFLGAVDGELVADLPMRAELCRVIRATRPDVVLAHDPWRPYRIHPDHQQAGLIAVDGIVAARDPHFFADQGLDRHRPRQLLCFEPGRIDHLERVDGYTDANGNRRWRSPPMIVRSGSRSPIGSAPRRAPPVCTRACAPRRRSPVSTICERPVLARERRPGDDPGPPEEPAPSSGLALLRGALARRATSHTLRRRLLGRLATALLGRCGLLG